MSDEVQKETEPKQFIAFDDLEDQTVLVNVSAIDCIAVDNKGKTAVMYLRSRKEITIDHEMVDLLLEDIAPYMKFNLTRIC